MIRGDNFPSNRHPNWEWIGIRDVPSTDRTAETLLAVLGYDSIEGLTDDIPYGGAVLDVGSGESPFFDIIAASRPDIRAVKFDFSYSNSIPDGTGLENLLHVAGDMRQMPFKEESFDWIFSYWALSYLIDKERSAVMEGLHALVKPGGKLSVGPVYDSNSGFIIPEVARTIVKHPSVDPSEWIAETAVKIRDHPECLFLPPLEK